MKSFLLIAFCSLCDLVCVASSLWLLCSIAIQPSQRTMANRLAKNVMYIYILLLSIFFFFEIKWARSTWRIAANEWYWEWECNANEMCFEGLNSWDFFSRSSIELLFDSNLCCLEYLQNLTIQLNCAKLSFLLRFFVVVTLTLRKYLLSPRNTCVQISWLKELFSDYFFFSLITDCQLFCSVIFVYMWFGFVYKQNIQ